MKNQVLNHIPPDKFNALSNIGKTLKIKAGTYYIRAGEIPKKLALVHKGLFRYVYLAENGDELTKGLIDKGHFITSYSAMITASPSYFFIEAIEDAEILSIDYQQWLALKAKDPFWDQVLIQILELAFMSKEKRERSFLLLDAKQRYQNFLNDFPDMESRVKQHIIASYLGIKPESLSRLKKK